MKRRTAFLGTSAGTITTPRPKGGLERMMEAQERETNRLRSFDQAGGADKPRE